MLDIKNSNEDVSYVLQCLSVSEPEDIECDNFDIAVNDDQFASFSIVRAAKLGHESIDRLTEENAQLKSDNVELVKALNGVMNIVAVSKGVDGYHCNGDVACWWDFDEIGEVSDLIKKTQGNK